LLTKKETLLLSAGVVALCGVVGVLYWAAREHARVGLEAPHGLYSDSAWEVTRIQAEDRSKPAFGPDQVYFKNGSMTNHIGFDLKYLGQLEAPDHSPVLIFKGRTCVNCDAGVSFLMYSPKNNQVGNYAYPAGRVSAEDADGGEEGNAYYSGRAFLGECRPQWRGIIAFGRHLDQQGAWEPVVQVYEFEEDGAFNGKAIYENLPDIAVTLKQVERGFCKEMPPEDYSDGS
jgi:hypothetical protein